MTPCKSSSCAITDKRIWPGVGAITSILAGILNTIVDVRLAKYPGKPKGANTVQVTPSIETSPPVLANEIRARADLVNFTILATELGEVTETHSLITSASILTLDELTSGLAGASFISPRGRAAIIGEGAVPCGRKISFGKLALKHDVVWFASPVDFLSSKSFWPRGA